MIELNWDEFCFQRIFIAPERKEVQIGSGIIIPWDKNLNFGAPVGEVNARALADAVKAYRAFAPWKIHPQIALLVFAATKRPQALNNYFPLTKILDAAGQRDFYRLAGKLMRDLRFEIRLLTITYPAKTWRIVDQTDHIATVSEVAFFVACHIAEIFFYQRPILERLLGAPMRIWLYATQKDFEKDGGAAGGNYNAERGCIQLVLSRLFEGFKGKTPGVAPFLHEFGHLLDHFDVKERRLTKSHGTLPGMRPSEGALYSPTAHNRFLKGKKLELDRAMHLHEHGYHEGEVMPIGHPYVFQNDGEFIAGYLEMFFRNPHTFAAQNPALYDSFQLTFGYDPSKAWAEDFPYYIEQNQAFYREHKPPKPGISV